MSDYVQDALRTKSDGFHATPELLRDLLGATTSAIYMSRVAGAIKKSLFYGKERAVYHEIDCSDLEKIVADNPVPSQVGLNVDVVHGILGMLTEACELAELLNHSLLTGEAIDRDKLVNELGDTQWYYAITVAAVSSTDQEVRLKNIAKLKARFPEKFESDLALNRDEAKENASMAAAQ